MRGRTSPHGSTRPDRPYALAASSAAKSLATEARELGVHECTFDASQLKEEAVLSKLPRTTHRIPYRDLGTPRTPRRVYIAHARRPDKTSKWHERYFVARREFLFWSRVDKEVRSVPRL